MKTAKVYYKGELRTAATHIKSGDSIITDAPPDNQGKGSAFSPTDLAATSLANCMMTVMAIGAQARNIEIVAMEAEVLKVMAQNPRRISEIHVDIRIRINPDTVQNREVLKQIGINCPVAKSLHPEIKQELNFQFQEPL